MRAFTSPSSIVVVLALLGAGACSKDNPNTCDPDFTTNCVDAGPDADIDAPPIEGCNANPGVCIAPIDTCVSDVCSDCNSGIDLDVQSAACTMAAMPICRAGNGCGPCADHEECTGGVCFQGTCATGVLYVDDNGDDSGGNTCVNPADPCATLSHALTFVPPIGGDANANRRFIRMQSSGTYTEPGVLNIDAKSVWITAPPPAPPPVGARAVLNRGNNGPVLTITNGADVRMDRLAVNDGTNNSAADGVSCASSTLMANGIEVFNNNGTGIVSDNCTLTLIGSVILNNDEGGISVTGTGRAVLVNNTVAVNGVVGSTFGGITLGPNIANTSVVQSNTIVGNRSSAITESDGLDCRIAGVVARNNIIFGEATRPRVSGACTHQNTLYGPAEPLPVLGALNGNMLVTDDAMFKFENPGARNYRLQIDDPPSVAKDKGSTTGLAPEAMTDIDGEPRPQGTADVGCDEIP